MIDAVPPCLKYCELLSQKRPLFTRRILASIFDSVGFRWAAGLIYGVIMYRSLQEEITMLDRYDL